MTLYSDQFNDIYFSQENGAEESRYVFLEKNGLPNRLLGGGILTICELGFGSGLNFLITVMLMGDAPHNSHLDYISIEKYPLDASKIRESLSKFDLPNLDRLCQQLPPADTGFHRLHITSQVTLTLIYDDVLPALSQLEASVDAWYLDGFAPAKNPEMWRDEIYAHMARLSAERATFSTFTAAGFVKRGLQAAGFDVQKVKGYGRKREMLCGHFTGEGRKKLSAEGRIAIIGGGLAGCAAAYSLRRAGATPVIFEAGPDLASGASGAPIAHVNPKLSPQGGAVNDYFMTAYNSLLSMLPPELKCACFHYNSDEKKIARHRGILELGLSPDTVQAEDGGIVFPRGAVVNPAALCHMYTEGIEVRLNTKITDLSQLADFSYIVFANSTAAKAFDLFADVRLDPIRGQLSGFRTPLRETGIALHFAGGYLGPVQAGGTQWLGATFKPFDDAIDIRERDNQVNIERYNQQFDKDVTPQDVDMAWAGTRCGAKDRLPLVGHIKDNLYSSLAHGSHGVIGSLIAGDILAHYICGNSLPVSVAAAAAVSPKRMFKPLAS